MKKGTVTHTCNISTEWGSAETGELLGVSSSPAQTESKTSKIENSCGMNVSACVKIHQTVPRLCGVSVCHTLRAFGSTVIQTGDCSSVF